MRTSLVKPSPRDWGNGIVSTYDPHTKIHHIRVNGVSRGIAFFALDGWIHEIYGEGTSRFGSLPEVIDSLR